MFPMGAMLLQLFAQLTVASGKLIGAVVVPHGDFAYDPKLVNDTGPPSFPPKKKTTSQFQAVAIAVGWIGRWISGASLGMRTSLGGWIPVDFSRKMRVEVEPLCDMELCG